MLSTQAWSGVVGLVAVLAYLSPYSLKAEEPSELAVIVNPSTPVRALSASELRAMFTRPFGDWPNGIPVTALNLAPSVPERAVFDRVVLRMEPDEVAQFWIDQKIRGDSPPPRHLSSAVAIVELVSRTPGAIGYVPLSTLKPRVKVVARIRHDQVVLP